MAALIVLAMGFLTVSRPMQGLTGPSSMVVIAAGGLGLLIIAGAAYALRR
jgi:LPXTG-motif cell wall-anchored protein